MAANWPSLSSYYSEQSRIDGALQREADLYAAHMGHDPSGVYSRWAQEISTRYLDATKVPGNRLTRRDMVQIKLREVQQERQQREWEQQTQSEQDRINAADRAFWRDWAARARRGGY